jgi:acylglycerol lipase
MSLSTLDMIVSTMDKSPNTFHLYKCPFIIIQGGLDKLVNPEVAFDLYDKSQTKSEDK